MIVAGDEPLMPIRELTFCPSLMDAVDRFAIERLDPGTVTFRQLTGCGHLVLDQARAQCGPLIRQMIAEHLK